MNSIPLLHLIDAQVMAMPKIIELIHPLLSFSFSLFPPFLAQRVSGPDIFCQLDGPSQGLYRLENRSYAMKFKEKLK